VYNSDEQLFLKRYLLITTLSASVSSVFMRSGHVTQALRSQSVSTELVATYVAGSVQVLLQAVVGLDQHTSAVDNDTSVDSKETATANRQKESHSTRLMRDYMYCINNVE